jgi:hypothetical protein
LCLYGYGNQPTTGYDPLGYGWIPQWVKDKASAAGGAINDGARAVGGAIKDGARAAGGAIRDAATSVGEAVQDGAEAAVDWTVESARSSGAWLFEGGSEVVTLVKLITHGAAAEDAGNAARDRVSRETGADRWTGAPEAHAHCVATCKSCRLNGGFPNLDTGALIGAGSAVYKELHDIMHGDMGWKKDAHNDVVGISCCFSPGTCEECCGDASSLYTGDGYNLWEAITSIMGER